ncbi:hypothetical protein OBBRIDRAFT_790700 [Obba rivulosa]|uniref:Small nuclear ribonucleoprotein Prp3 C-terminal domain-containing protein n=1 Tax=Obba rivulosa TaxID=1052685 RepID=A0A8E2AZ30_9APHY|nr:hypothetical protein OBBRIDRAFT_790700 [Obba rivulosa]
MLSTTTLPRQLEELHLLKCSLLPGEHLEFVPPSKDAEWWEIMLEGYPGNEDNLPTPPSPARLEITIDHAPVQFQVELPSDYGGGSQLDGVKPLVSVKGDSISRSEQERWQKLVKDTLSELSGSEYIVYELISVYILPQLHAEYDGETSSSTSPPPCTQAPPPIASAHYHALLTSHHLISPNKRRSLRQWSSALSLTGFAKVGYPGVIYCEGVQEHVEEFVTSVKAMQWLALRVRFVEPAPESSGSEGSQERRWVEFEKVGEVVEEMRRLGREDYVTEMGIGSVGANPGSTK